MRGDLEFQSTGDLVQKAALRYGDAHAIEDGDTVLSYRQLAALVDAAARGLFALHIEKGDRVAIWAPNLWEWIVAALAIHTVGGVLVPINTRYKGEEARYILDRAQVKAVFTVDGFLGLDFVSMLDRPELPTIRFRTSDWEKFIEAGVDGSVEVLGADVCDILFTSGTTGEAKGVITTHAQTLRVYRDWSEVVGLQRTDRYLVVAPFFHCFGYKAGIIAGLLSGATLLPQAMFDVSAVLERIGRDRVTVLPGPPALYQSILMKDYSEANLSTLRLAVTGAATIPVQLIHDMREKLGFDRVITGYGLTESTGVATMCRYDDAPETIAKTSGRALSNVEVKTVDTSGAEVPAGEPGHVLVKGYNVMVAYLDDPKATAENVVDGWLHTGDIGILDENGYLRITDRLKDMFICGGFNAYPAEIEHTLLNHPQVNEVAVIGIPDRRLGEVGMAWVVADEQLTEDALIDWARPRLANFKVPRRVEFVDVLPRNASTKVMKYALRQRFEDAPDRIDPIRCAQK